MTQLPHPPIPPLPHHNSSTTPITATTTTNKPPPPLPLRIVTHNIRYAASASSRLPHEPAWPQRLPALVSELTFLTRGGGRSVVCLQEVLTQQIQGIAKGLNEAAAEVSMDGGDHDEEQAEWRWRGVARDDGENQGERCVILFQGGEWREVHFETVWLNETGEVGRKGWDAGSVRVVSCLVLDAVAGLREDGKEGENRVGKRVLVMNTHLDNAGAISRAKSAKILLQVAHRLTSKWNVDFWVIAGDLNSEEDGEAYQILQRSGMGAKEARVKDAMKVIPQEERGRRYGEYHTYTGFDGEGDEDGKVQRIDFVFVGGEEKGGRSVEGSVRGYAVMPNGWEDDGKGRMSDHRAVCVDLGI